MTCNQPPLSAAGAQEIWFGGERLVLLPDRVVWMPDRRVLLAADVHLGKELVFRRNGVPIPDGATTTNLQKLRLLSQKLQVKKIWILGDLVHGRPSAALMREIQSWSKSLGDVEVHLVQGNHDRHGATELAKIDLHRCAAAIIGQLNLVHHAAPGEKFQIGGHLHPVTRISIGRHKALRVPAFIVQGRQLILPAFGEFTGGLLMRPAAGQIRFPILGDQVVRLA